MTDFKMYYVVDSIAIGTRKKMFVIQVSFLLSVFPIFQPFVLTNFEVKFSSESWVLTTLH